MTSKLKIDTRVRSLKQYLTEFEEGKFQIPSFQRDFLWSQDDVKQLFDSIKNNYPVGSILFWGPQEFSQQIGVKSIIGPYKINDNALNNPVFILDGYQRLSSLFGCLTNPKKYNSNNLELIEKKWNEKFNLYYDLEEEQFIYLRQRSKNLPFQVPVYVFMNSVDFRQYSRKYFDIIEDEKKLELYLDRADELGQILNNYQIASVDINYASIEEAVEIFRRVNEKGHPISKDWIVSALTNRGTFRLGTEIDNLINELKQYNFHRIKRDVIFQCIQNSFGKIYFDYKIEELLKMQNFEEVTLKTLQSVKVSIKFLFEELNVFNNKLLPYNSQLIFLSSFFNAIEINSISEIQKDKLKKWFWITSYSNYFTINSLSKQRKAFEQFSEFINEESKDPVYNDLGENMKFTTLEFPDKVNMGSVRAKALTLFLIKYAIGNEIITSDNIEDFEFGNIFSIPQKDNPIENFVPIIEKRIILEGNIILNSPSHTKRPKDYSFLLQSNENLNLFISQEMINKFDGSEESKNDILQIRKFLIMTEEKEFVELLGLNYD